MRLKPIEWETAFYPVQVLGGVALSLSLYEGGKLLASTEKKGLHPWVQTFYPVLGLGFGGRLLEHCQAPVLYWINFSLRLQRTDEALKTLTSLNKESRPFS